MANVPSEADQCADLQSFIQETHIDENVLNIIQPDITCNNKTES
jgi:hypothetical protein